MYNQFLLPVDQYNINKGDLDLNSTSFNANLNGVMPFPSGKSIIRFLAKKFNLKRSDEVYISTTSNSSFVSSCVTCTFFNYCKVSRVITPNTKMIYIIHEFGFPNQKIKELVTFFNDKKIPVVEDIAHSFNSKMGDELLGRIAPYGFCSLPKFTPMKKGAFFFNNCNNLTISETNKENDEILSEFSVWSKHLNYFKIKSQINYKLYQSELSCFEPVYSYDDNIHPFVYAFKHEKYDFINDLLEKSGTQVARTYVKNYVMLPINPIINKSQIEKNINILKQFI